MTLLKLWRLYRSLPPPVQEAAWETLTAIASREHPDDVAEKARRAGLRMWANKAVRK